MSPAVPWTGGASSIEEGRVYRAGPRPVATRECTRHPGEGCDCIAPLMPPKVPAQSEPERLNSNERMRLRAAAAKASRDYPGPVGKLVAREILAYEEFAWRYDKGGQMDTLVEHILKP